MNNPTKQLKRLDNKVQGLLLWSTIFAFWSYLLLIFRIFKIYAILKGEHPALLAVTLFLIYTLFGGIVFVVWRNVKYNGLVAGNIHQGYIKYQIIKLSGQRKLISMYLLGYAALLSASSAFFFFDVNKGLYELLVITTPISLIAYGMGLFFIIKFSRQQKQLNELEKKIRNIMIMNKIAQN